MRKNVVTISSKLNFFFLICGFSMLVSELWKQWYLTFQLNGGSYQWWYFPFQLCSINMYVLLFLPWIKKTRIRRALLTFLMCYGLLGGIAVFVDTSGLNYPVLCLTIHSYLWHILLIGIGIIAGIAYMKMSRLDAADLNKSGLKGNEVHHFPYKSFIDSTILYLICCLFASIINGLANPKRLINMFYINPAYKMQQIGFSTLVKYIGNTPAILLYMAATIVGAGILFHIWKYFFRYYQQKQLKVPHK